MLIKSPEEMIKLWNEIAKKNSKILLYWDLWAGKTHFSKWFAQWIWINPDKVQSPTYTYINIYENKLLHMDMYRLNDLNEFIEKWILDQIWEYDYVIIERPKFEENYVDNSWLKIQINKISENEREITLH